LSNRFKARSSTKMLPMDMPESVDAMALQTSRDGGRARKDQMILSAPRVDSPEPEEVVPTPPPKVDLLKTGGSPDDDTLDRPEYIWSASKGINRRNKAWVRRLADSALALPAPEPERKPTPLTSPVNSDDEGMS
jgi:hypothetical protein